jgi:hypothetical protein
MFLDIGSNLAIWVRMWGIVFAISGYICYTHIMTNPHQTLSEWQFLLLDEIKKEYEAGLLALNSLPANTVTFYGGSRVEKDDKAYNLTKNIAKQFSKKGWGVVSGGGPGIMEAAIVGAGEGKNGKSVAFRIDLVNEAHPPKLI